jgi:hypothetical protein
MGLEGDEYVLGIIIACLLVVGIPLRWIEDQMEFPLLIGAAYCDEQIRSWWRRGKVGL